MKETLVFIITNQLEISQALTIMSITLLNKLNVKALTAVEELTVIVGPTKVRSNLFV